MVYFYVPVEVFFFLNFNDAKDLVFYGLFLFLLLIIFLLFWIMQNK